MAKAVGFGGVFLKARDPQALGKWYAEHLGIPSQEGGSLAFDVAGRARAGQPNCTRLVRIKPRGCPHRLG